MKKLYRIKIGDINIAKVRRNIGEGNISSSEERELEELNDPVWVDPVSVDIDESSDGIQETSGKQPEPKFTPGQYLTNHTTGLTQWTEYYVDAAFVENEESDPEWKYVLTKCTVTTIIDGYDARNRHNEHSVKGSETRSENWLVQHGFRKKRMRTDSYLWKKWETRK